MAVAESGSLNDPRIEKNIDDVHAPAVIYDIGEQTIAAIEKTIAGSGTVI